jgi:CRISPR-associated protein Cse2 (CRISPR_cse2).
MPPDVMKFDFRIAVASLAQAILEDLDPGEVARLRRMAVDGAGEAEYWRLAAEAGFLNRKHERWLRVVKLVALLCPRGEVGKRGRLHDMQRPLGHALCDGGNINWPLKEGDSVRPAFSEKRLSLLLEAPPAKRFEQLERIVRWLANVRQPDSGVDCTEIAALVLFDDATQTLRRVAEKYYLRLSKAAFPSNEDDDR